VYGSAANGVWGLLLLDDLVGERAQGRRYVGSKCPRSLQIDDELKLGHLNDRKVGGFLALENAPGNYDRMFAEAGGLMSYGSSEADLASQVGLYMVSLVAALLGPAAKRRPRRRAQR
jgi:hypothetical protein